MTATVGQTERATQNRIIELFREELGYRFLGTWDRRDKNSNIEEDILTQYLSEKGGYTKAQISAALQKLTTEATNKNRSLYENNQVVYELLRYGVPVKVEAGSLTQSVHLINWQQPEKNDFAVAEEVTLKGRNERRPDLVLYVNGIAIGVIELKNSRVSIGSGIRQSLSNQKKEFNEWFFSTIQFVFAGNDSEGLRYGTIGTPEKYFLSWKEDVEDNTRLKLDKYLLKMCEKNRLIDLMHNFVLFDNGVKKLPRVHQYFGIKAAQDRIAEKEGGIIWHTQGSGKSIVMVLLAKWILENNPHARVAVVTDRDELDKQIEAVFQDSGERIERSSSSSDLMRQLSQPKPRLLCSLIHKFGVQDDKTAQSDQEFEKYLQKLKDSPSKTVGDVFVLVDECHRTQSGRLHRLMKATMPEATFIGFTGTPLLKKDQKTSHEVFGSYIHTYKLKEAVDDGVILDLVYEARDVDQTLGNQNKIDQWFTAKTRGLNKWQTAELKKRWGTLQSVLSSRSRMDRIVSDIVFDFGTKPRLISSRGNAMLVASSIYEACKYFKLFQQTGFRDKCAIVTSYNPQARDVSLEEIGVGTETDKQFVYNTYTELLQGVSALPGKTKSETYEDAAKAKFVDEPSQMRLLVVVDKLLTGFNAPACTYLYIDKSMQDHGLFQAICRTNRLDGEDKDFGFIVDYKDLFRKVEKAIAVYTSEVETDSGDGKSSEILLEERLAIGRERLDNAIEALELLCEPVEPPKGELECLKYFCGNTEIADDLSAREKQRTSLYQLTAGFIRAYANIADELIEAGYSDAQITKIKEQLNYYKNLRDMIRLASGESLDLKPYEADMRYLIDTYIDADEPRKISDFDNVGLIDLVVKTGIADAIAAKLGNKNKDAVAETIENNVRSKIIREQILDPAFYDRMSELLTRVIANRRRKAIEYEEYLGEINNIIAQLARGRSDDTPEKLDSPGKRAVFNVISKSIEDEDTAVEKAIELHNEVLRVRPDGWRGSQAKERVIQGGLFNLLQDRDLVKEVFEVISAQGEY